MKATTLKFKQAFTMIIAVFMAIIFLMPAAKIQAAESPVYINVETMSAKVFGDLSIVGYFFADVKVDTVDVKNNIIAQMQELDSLITTKYQSGKTDAEQSFVYKFNNNISATDETLERDGKTYYPLDRHSYIMLKRAQDEFYDDTFGLFDPTVYPLVELWGLDSSHIHDEEPITIPAKSQIDTYMRYVGVKDKISILEEDGKYYAAKTHANVKIDFGAQAKGYGADLIKAYFDTVDGIIGSFYSLSGNAYFYGVVPLDGSGNVINTNNIKMVSSKNFTVGISTPYPEWIILPEYETFVKFEIVSPMSPVTSGTYQRYRMRDGVSYCHIIDPRTGFPANLDVTFDSLGEIQSIKNITEKAVRSATIFDVSSETADVYATCALLLGLDGAIEWINSIEQEAVIICEDNVYANLSKYKAIVNADGSSIGTWAVPFFDFKPYLDYGFGEANYKPPNALTALQVVFIVLIVFGVVIMAMVVVTELLKRKSAKPPQAALNETEEASANKEN